LQHLAFDELRRTGGLTLQSPEGDFAHCNMPSRTASALARPWQLQSPEGDFAHCNYGISPEALVLRAELSLQSPEGDFAHCNVIYVVSSITAQAVKAIAIPRRGFCALQPVDDVVSEHIRERHHCNPPKGILRIATGVRSVLAALPQPANCNPPKGILRIATRRRTATSWERRVL